MTAMHEQLQTGPRANSAIEAISSDLFGEEEVLYSPTPEPPPEERGMRRGRLPRRKRNPELTVEQVLAWADAHRERTGKWPRANEPGWVTDAPREQWRRLHACLRLGLRGLPGGLSLPQLLAQYRGARNPRALPPVTEEKILAWADAHYERTGDWPTGETGPIADAPGETWNAVQVALGRGKRGLRGGSSLAQLLAERRGKRNRAALAPFSIERILDWADAHFARTGRWPTARTGPVSDAPGETWLAVQKALIDGRRGLPGGSSLPRLLAAEGRVDRRLRGTRLSIDQILAWADDHRRRTGSWPKASSGPVLDAPGEHWARIHGALKSGSRGLEDGGSLPRLLLEHRRVRHRELPPPLSEEQVLAWADAHFAAIGRWPNGSAGPVLGAPGESWDLVASALRKGRRGLPGGMSLVQLLEARRGVRNPARPPRLRIQEILRWADSHHERTGWWPGRNSGPVPEAPGETWGAIDLALSQGGRGLEGGSSIPRLLAAERGRPRQLTAPPLQADRILEWADLHHARTRMWPQRMTGPVVDAPWETWSAIDRALRWGYRGFPGGTSLAKFLIQNGRKRGRQHRPDLSFGHILNWADAHYIRHGRWPTAATGPVEGAPGESWASLQSALLMGYRGLPAGWTIPKLLKHHRQLGRGE